MPEFEEIILAGRKINEMQEVDSIGPTKLVFFADPTTGRGEIIEYNDYIAQLNLTSKGYAAPSFDPGTPTTPVTYQGEPGGTYTHFPGQDGNPVVIPLTDGQDYVIVPTLNWTGSYWVAKWGKANISGFATKIDLLPFPTTVPGKNLFDKTQTIPNTAINSSTGALTTISEWSISKPIKVLPSTTYTYSGGSLDGTGMRVRYLDTNKNFLSFQNGSTNPFPFTTPSGCIYIEVPLTVSNANNINNIQVEAGSVATEFETYRQVVPKEQLDLSAVVLKTDTTLVKATYTGKNKFNKTALIHNTAISNSDGGLVTLTDWTISQPIEVLPNTAYTQSGGSLGAGKRARFLNGNMAFISFLNASADPFTFTTPANTAYVEIMVNTGGSGQTIDDIQLEQNDHATSFETYFRGIDPALIQTQATTIVSPLKDTVNSFYGDSITAFNQFQGIMQGIVEGFTYYNDGVAGSLVQTGTDNLQYDSTNRIPMGDDRRIKALLLSNPQIIWFWGGTNDWAYQGYTSTTSVAVNFAGFKVSYAYILDKIRTGFPSGISGNSTPVAGLPTAKIMCIGMLARGNDRNQYEGATGQKAYIEAAKDIALSRGCKFIDMRESGITYENIASFTDDNVHPSNPFGMTAVAKFFVSKYA